MKNIYSNLNEKKFKILTITICIISDLFTAGWIYLNFSKKAEFDRSLEISLKMLRQIKHPAASYDKSFFNELWGVFIQTLVSIILLYLLVHLVIYALHWYGKKAAKGYIVFYAWSAGILMGISAILNISNSVGLFAIPSILLLFIAFGFKNLKSEEV